VQMNRCTCCLIKCEPQALTSYDVRRINNGGSFCLASGLPRRVKIWSRKPKRKLLAGS